MRYKSLVSVLIIVLFSCKKKNDYSQVKIIGHAAAGLKTSQSPYHDNSLEAIQYALNMEGLAGIEVDVQCSASGTAWLFHNEELGDETNGSGCIPSQEDSYLDGLHYSTLLKEEVIRLGDVTFPFDTHQLILDIRSANTCLGTLIDQQKMIDAIFAAFPGIQPYNVTVITNKESWISAFYTLGWSVYLNVETVDMYMESNFFSQTAGICMKNSDISASGVTNIKNSGKKVMLFNVRSAKGIRSALKKMPEYLMTDDIKATLIEQSR